jgi:DNA-binding NtrC family response regulator
MSLRILVVEDDDLVRAQLTQFLIDAGYSAEGREKAITALAALDLRVKVWDVVISDINLPKMDGFEFIARLKVRHPHISTILMTGDVKPGMEQEAKRLGAIALLQKPFSLHQLRRLLTGLEQSKETGTKEKEVVEAPKTGVVFEPAIAWPQSRPVY